MPLTLERLFILSTEGVLSTAHPFPVFIGEDVEKNVVLEFMTDHLSIGAVSKRKLRSYPFSIRFSWFSLINSMTVSAEIAGAIP